MAALSRRLIWATLLALSLAGCGGTKQATVDQPQPTVSPMPVPYAGIQPPYPAPASCAVASWTSNEERKKFPAFWLDGDGVAAGDPIGPILFAGGQKIQWQTADPQGSGDLAVTGQYLDGVAPPMEAQNVYEVGPGAWSSATIFPAAGCWRIQATNGTHHLDLIVYVYPNECRPANLRDPSASPTTRACTAP